MTRERPGFDAAALIKFAEMRHRLLNDAPTDPNAPHQAPITMNLPVFLADRVAQIHAPSEPITQKKNEVHDKGGPAPQAFDLAKEHQPALCIGVGELGQKEPAEQAGQHTHWQEKTGFAVDPACTIERYPAAWHDHMDMWMMGHC